MPLLDHNKLGNEREWGRAFTVLATIAYGYVWQNGETNPTKVFLETKTNVLIIYFNQINLHPDFDTSFAFHSW